MTLLVTSADSGNDAGSGRLLAFAEAGKSLSAFSDDVRITNHY
jgi:hypothetical protein